MAGDAGPDWGLPSDWVTLAWPGQQVQTTTNIPTTSEKKKQNLKKKKEDSSFSTAQHNSQLQCFVLCIALPLSLDFS